MPWRVEICNFYKFFSSFCRSLQVSLKTLLIQIVPIHRLNTWLKLVWDRSANTGVILKKSKLLLVKYWKDCESTLFHDAKKIFIWQYFLKILSLLVSESLKFSFAIIKSKKSNFLNKCLPSHCASETHGQLVSTTL